MCLFISITACSQQDGSSVSQEESTYSSSEENGEEAVSDPVIDEPTNGVSGNSTVDDREDDSPALIIDEPTDGISGNPTVDGREEDSAALIIDEPTNSISGNPTIDGREEDSAALIIDEPTNSVSGNPTVDGKEDDSDSVSAIDESDKEKIMLEIQNVIKSYKGGTISNKGTTVSSFDPAPSDVRFPVISRRDDFNVAVTGIGSDVVVSLDAGTYLMHIDLHIDNLIWTAYSATFQLK